LPPSATTIRISAAQRDNEYSPGHVQPVFGLV
jgi:hypothetical protein